MPLTTVHVINTVRSCNPLHEPYHVKPGFLSSCAVNNQQSLTGHDLGCDFLCILHQEVITDIHDNTPKGHKDILGS